MLCWLSYAVADSLVRVLPRRWAERAAVVLARLTYLARVPARARLEYNLSRLLDRAPDRSVRALARESFANFALSFVDFLRLGHGDPRSVADMVEVHGAEHLDRARTSGRGVILLSAHLGNWELGAAWLASGGTPIHLVARPHRSRWVERLYRRRRRAWGVRLVHGQAMWRAAEALRRREWVALMADRGAQNERGAGRASVCAWAAALARRTRALVLPAVIVRLSDRRYAAYFEPPLDPSAARAEGFVEPLRRHLRRHARQWFAFEALPEGLA